MYVTTKRNEADIIIDRKITYQTIDGFGASLCGAWHEQYFHESVAAADREAAMDLLFTDRGLALDPQR